MAFVFAPPASALLDTLGLPIWWYTKGLKQILVFVWAEIRSFATLFNIPILSRSLFKPMYGQTDWQSRLISFFVRLIHLSALMIVTMLWTLILTFFALMWLVFPLIVVMSILYQLGIPDEHILLSLAYAP